MTGSSEMSEGERDRAQRYRAASLEGEGERDGEAEGEGGTPLLPSAATNAEYDDVEEQEVPPSPAFTEGDEAEPWERSAGRQAPGMSRSASNTSHRAVKSAQKVAQVLGTTRGEVRRLFFPSPPSLRYFLESADSIVLFSRCRSGVCSSTTSRRRSKKI